MSENERRDTPTIEAPPPSSAHGERITQPPESEPPRGTMLPQAPSYFEDAAKKFGASLIEMRETRAEIAKGFRDQETKQAERHAEAVANAQLVASAIRAHGDRLIALERGQEQTAKGMTTLEEQIKLARSAADEAVSLARQALNLVANLEARLPQRAE